MNYNDYYKELEKHDIVLSLKQKEQFKKYQEYLIQENKKINLTSIVEEEEIINKHFYDSSLLCFNANLNGSLVDIGSGAGFPGVVIKILYPNLKVTLVEPIKKRCDFLDRLIKYLDLNNIEVICTRGEDFSLKNREKYDFVTARAVSNLNILIEVSGALVKKGGQFIALRGKDGEKDVEDAKNAIKSMGFEVHKNVEMSLYDGSKRNIYYLNKIKDTPKSFPRQYSIIKKNPL